MDFHNLTRRELQTLCKKNKIPANITNVAMADALKALEIVEGIEEFLNPAESETAQSSIESPEKLEVTSPCVPRTEGRTTRRKTAEVDNSQTLTRARRSTRKLVETPAATSSKRAAVASVRRKMDNQLKEVEENKKIGKKDISGTPGVLPARVLMGESTVRRVYGTRQSARLVQKNNLKENEKLETVKSELFSEDSGENLDSLEMNVKECSDDLGEIIDTTDINLNEQLEERLEINNDKEVASDENSDYLLENQIQLDKDCSENFAVVKPGMKAEENGVRGDRYDVESNTANNLKAKVYTEICEETDPSAQIFDKSLKVADDAEEKSGSGDLYLTKTQDVLENADKLDTNPERVSENVAAESVQETFTAHKSVAFFTDNRTLKMRDEMNFTKEEDGSHGNLSVTDKVLENSKEENAMRFKDGASDDLEAIQCSEDLAALDINDGCQEKEESGKSLAEESPVILPKIEEQGTNPFSAEITNSFPEESIANNLIEEPIVPALKASADEQIECKTEDGAKSCDVMDSEKPPTKQLEILGTSEDPLFYNPLPIPTPDYVGEVHVFSFTEDPSKILSSLAETALSHTVLPTCLTPLKKSATPVKKSASKKTPTTTKKLIDDFDNKENIDNSGTKLILTKDKKKPQDFGQTQYADVSLRKLRKELKEKMITKNLNKDEKGKPLQPLSEKGNQSLY